MINEDFIGGTLVEYSQGYGWSKEWARGIITRFESNKKKNYWLILTEGAKPALSLDELVLGQKFAKYTGNGYIEDFRNGIYYLDGGPYLNINYCFAVKGVEIQLL